MQLARACVYELYCIRHKGELNLLSIYWYVFEAKYH